jgi:very-short-patch-repair endonuclease
LERGLECALRRGVATVAAVDATARRLRGAGRRGPPVLLEVLGRRGPGAPPTGSDLETCLLQLTRRAGLPDPERQVELRVGDRTIYIDFGWRPCRLALEADGADTHASAKALVDDLRRQNHIVQGWVLLRFSYDDVHRYANTVCQILRETWLLLQTGPLPLQLARWR